MNRLPKWMLPSLAGFLAMPAVALQRETPPAESVAEDPEEQLQEILDDYTDAMNAFSEAYSAAENEEDQAQIVDELYPDSQGYVKRMMAFAERYPETDACAKALAWVVDNDYGTTQKEAFEILLADHFDSEVMGQVARQLPGTEQGLEALRALLVESPHRSVQGNACFALARHLKPRSERGDAAEFLDLMKRVVEDYAEIEYFPGYPLGPMAEGELFEHQYLRIGKPVPEIAAEDIDGVPFKLSDYRGKVVMLDFWGHW